MSHPRHDISMVFKFGVIRWPSAIVPIQSFADSSHGHIIEQHVQCMQSPMHVAESDTLSDSSWLHSSMHF